MHEKALSSDIPSAGLPGLLSGFLPLHFSRTHIFALHPSLMLSYIFSDIRLALHLSLDLAFCPAFIPICFSEIHSEIPSGIAVTDA